MSGSTAFLPLLLLATLHSPVGRKEPDAAGRWLGEMKLGEEKTVFRLTVIGSGETLSASADLSPAGPPALAASKVAATPSGLRFELPLEPAPLAFEGSLREGGLELGGVVRRGEMAGTLRMIHLAPPLTQQQKDAVTGMYRSKGDATIWIGPFGEFGGELYFLDFSSGRFGALYPRSATTFAAGPGIVSPIFPLEVEIAVETDKAGQGTGLRHRSAGGAEVQAARQVPRRSEVRFQNGEVALAGTLTRPTGAGRHPAIVLLHGSGPEDRSFLGPWIDFFAAQGLAVLAYDKRGVGASGGDWKTAGLDELAGDGEAAFRLLAGRPEIDRTRIGLFGISQGGWLVPKIAAGLQPPLAAAFAIVHSSAAVSPALQGQQHLEHELRAYGLAEESIAEALAFQRQDDEVTRSGRGWEELQAAYVKAVEAKAPWLYANLRPANDPFRTMFRKMLDFDPLRAWGQVRCPVLALFGELDFQVPPTPNADLLRQALTASGRSRFEIVVLTKANHLFLQAGDGTMAEYPRLQAFEPSYFPRLAAWIKVALPPGAARPGG